MQLSIASKLSQTSNQSPRLPKVKLFAVLEYRMMMIVVFPTTSAFGRIKQYNRTAAYSFAVVITAGMFSCKDVVRVPSENAVRSNDTGR
jgi:hypothetical protein